MIRSKDERLKGSVSNKSKSIVRGPFGEVIFFSSRSSINCIDLNISSIESDESIIATAFKKSSWFISS
jgi:hypothetical protein